MFITLHHFNFQNTKLKLAKELDKISAPITNFDFQNTKWKLAKERDKSKHRLQIKFKLVQR